MPKHQPEAKPLKRKLREFMQVIFWALALALMMRATVVSAYHVPSGSMIPTLLVGDQFLACPSAYGLKLPFTGITVLPLGEPQRGDVVTFKNPLGQGPDWVKRIIGLPGETVAVSGTKIYINGEPLADPWGRYFGGEKVLRGNFGPVNVPEGHYFMMGDNRDNSMDSRFWAGPKGGFVPRENIKGKALFIYWSWPEKGLNPRWQRLTKAID